MPSQKNCPAQNQYSHDGVSVSPPLASGKREAAHFSQIHASLRCASGTRAIACGLIAVSRHQHGASKLPLWARAHALGPPQSGQIPFSFGPINDVLRLSVGMSLIVWPRLSNILHISVPLSDLPSSVCPASPDYTSKVMQCPQIPRLKLERTLYRDFLVAHKQEKGR